MNKSALALCVLAAACRTTTSSTVPAAADVVIEDRVVAVPIDATHTAKLGAIWARPAGASLPGPIVIVVPGARDVSRKGTRADDGAAPYPHKVDVTVRLVEALAHNGYRALAYDKRTCGPQDDAVCKRNASFDLDVDGPAAMAKDVDAACALAAADPSSDGRIVLWAHGQAAQVALSSSCAQRAAAIVLASPIPRAVDDVIVDGLTARMNDAKKQAQHTADKAEKARLDDVALGLKNKSATQRRTFDSMKKGLFDKTARVQDATIAYWTAWFALTDKTPALIEQAGRPVVVVLGGKDGQYGPADADRIRALGRRPGATLVELGPADHHLLVGGAFDASALAPVWSALDAALRGAPPS